MNISNKLPSSATPASLTPGTGKSGSRRFEFGIVAGWTVLVLTTIIVGAAMSRFIMSGLSAQSLPDDPLLISNAWIRATPPGAISAAAYVTIRNTGEDDHMLGVTYDGAQVSEIHATIERDGLLQMGRVEAIALPANQRLDLAPGAYHIMLMDLTRGFTPGDIESITLIFEKAGSRDVEFVVRDAREMM